VSDETPGTGGTTVRSMALALPVARPAEKTETPIWAHLVERIKAEDPAAFEAVIDLVRDAGWRLACQHLNDAHQAQDVLQEAYIVVFTRIHTLREPTSFRSWFLRIVVNLCRNARRAKGRRPLLSAEDALPEPLLADTDRFEERIDSDLSMRQALTGLSDLERTSILLRDYLQLSYQEMADILRVPLGTVKSRLNAARKHLLKCLRGGER